MRSRDSATGGQLTIGELAAHFGLAPHVLRHWEAMGLLDPVRNTAGHRRYHPADVTRVAVILRAKEAGLGLETIRALVSAGGLGTRRGILRREAGILRARIAAAQASLERIECALGCGHEDITRCPHYRRLSARATRPSSP
ncbi:MerR family transcriptional regulator [Streptomyces sp. NPDC050738]|uniref:helix-turn-helix domain-containing protein n=1 Tax=Streptomyces sp. NPDC050738 TaxID=3154744 RepID=UPI0034474376